MTVETIYAPVRLNGDGVTVIFAFGFIAPTIGDIKVTLIDALNAGTLQVIITDYTVILNPTGIGGTVTMVVSPLAVEDLLIELILADTQITDIPNVGGLQEEKIEIPLDRRALVSQLQAIILSRNISISVLDETNIAGFNGEIANFVADGILQVNPTGNGVTTTLLAALGAIGYPVSNGISIATGANTFIARNLVSANTDVLTITNPDGVSGNMIIDPAPLASTANGKGASNIGIQDAAGRITATNVEGALAELAPGFEIFTSSGTFTPTVTGLYKITVTGGGGGGDTATQGGAGGAGGTAVVWVTLIASTGYTVVVGAGGAADTTGGNSTFTDQDSNVHTGSGGVGATTSAGALGGSAAANSLGIELVGGDGGSGDAVTTNRGGVGGASIWGGGGRGGINADGEDARAFGAGGGNTSAGKAGIVVVEF